MAGFCLPEKEVSEFKRKLRDGTIDPEKLVDMDSEGRRAFFDQHILKGGGAEINRLFESRMLLKNQQAAYITWAKQLLGVRPEVRRDLISRIEKLDERILNPAEEKAFLTDLAEQKLGISVSHAEATQILDLSNKVKDARETMEAGGDRLAYGRSVVELNNFINERKQNANRLRLQDFRDRPGQTAVKTLSRFPGFTKSIQAAFDNSALLRQGWKTLWTNPVIWARNARKSFVDIARTFGNKPVMDELNADLVSRENALNGYYGKAKLAIGTMEEAFPTTLPERVPFLGRAYKASENAFTGFVHKTRADVFDKMIDIAKKTGVDLNDTELQNIGRLVNSLTGRGHLGKMEVAADVVNNVFFSPRFLKSQFDVLGGHALTGGAGISEIATGKNTGSNFVRKQAAQNMVKIILGTAGTLALAQAVGKAFGKDDVVEWNPQSSDFGKIKIGDSRFEVAGGASSVVTLAARLLTGKSKSSMTGKVTDLTKPKFGQNNRLDVLEQFFENKLSPIGQLAKNAIKGETFEHDPLYPISEHKLDWLFQATDLVTPMPIKNAAESLRSPKSAPLLAVILADALGIGANTYSQPKKKAKGHATPAQRIQNRQDRIKQRNSAVTH